MEREKINSGVVFNSGVLSNLNSGFDFFKVDRVDRSFEELHDDRLFFVILIVVFYHYLNFLDRVDIVIDKINLGVGGLS
jgi:hypothetical protein